MKNESSGLVFDIQRYTLHDGPGIRTMIFLQGCPLHCIWCHSPESQSFVGHLAVNPILCVGVEDCGECLKVCKQKALNKTKPTYSKILKKDITAISLDRNLCSECGDCAKVCYPKALYFTSKSMCVDEVMKIVEKDRLYYEKTGGGITISGGEPMVQNLFAYELLKESKYRGLHTALDTSGCVDWGKYEPLLPYVDLFLYDLKIIDDEKSSKFIGVSSSVILHNLFNIAEKKIPIQIRVPVIPSINDDDENLKTISRICKKLGDSLDKVQLLPYHKLGTSKYERIGLEYKMPPVDPPSKFEMQRIKNLFERDGHNVIVG